MSAGVVIKAIGSGTDARDFYLTVDVHGHFGWTEATRGALMLASRGDASMIARVMARVMFWPLDGIKMEAVEP